MAIRRNLMVNTIAVSAVLLVCLTIVISCGIGGGTDENKSEEPAERPSEFTIATYPMVDGSTSAQPLQYLIACRLLGSECAWMATPSLGGTGQAAMIAVTPVRTRISADEHKSQLDLAVKINGWIRHRGTHQSYENLIQGSVDLILVARQPSEDELKLAKGTGVKLDIRPVALDAFVFIANKENPVKGLTTEQIRRIYTGKVQKWSEVGGPDQKLNAYQRERNSGSEELMRGMVMKDLEPIDAPDMIAMSMMGPFNRLDRDEWGLGYSVFFYEQRMAMSLKTKLLAVDGCLPSPETIGSREYPYTSEVYVVVRKDVAEDGTALRLRDWMLTPKGQSVIAESGYVPISAAGSSPAGVR
jgi:phosphate transport system substrate-binding protein